MKIRKVLNKMNPTNALLGKKEKGLGDFHIECVDCGELINLDDTSCPKKIKKIIKRNLKMRGIAMLALQKMNPRCSDCQKKFLEKGGKLKKVSGSDMLDMAEEASEEAKKKIEK